MMICAWCNFQKRQICCQRVDTVHGRIGLDLKLVASMFCSKLKALCCSPDPLLSFLLPSPTCTPSHSFLHSLFLILRLSSIASSPQTSSTQNLWCRHQEWGRLLLAETTTRTLQRGRYMSLELPVFTHCRGLDCFTSRQTVDHAE